MKKFLTAFLFVCSCALVGAAVGCAENGPQSGSESSTVQTPAQKRNVRFETGEGYSFLSNVAAGNVIGEGSQLNFEVELDAFYAANNLQAFVNDSLVTPDADGIYSVTVGAEDLTVRVEGVQKDVSNMPGTGSTTDAFVVTKPIDLLFIADKVNSGDTNYSRACYVLANDIDCKGETLEIIGDYSSQNAVFSGSFVCDNNPETGEYEPHTISNFNINSNDSNYVGLFGAVFADMSLESTALFYGVSIDNFTVNATPNEILADNKTISCGGLVGYGVGANFFLCDATNGEVNVTADSNYFSFVGGLIGYQQGFFDEGYGMYYPSEVNYSVVDVDVNIFSGVALYAGGISGFMTSNYPFGAIASVHNSYSTGSVSGALRSGGIVGGLGRYSSVSNCYATGDITARSYQSFDSELITSTDYCYAYAGGIAGYAENDSIAHDCFFNGTVSASTASDKLSSTVYAVENTGVADGDKENTAAAGAQKYATTGLLSNVELSDPYYLGKTLGWQTHDWTFTAGELPLINYDAPTGTVKLSMTIKYVAPKATDAKILINGKESIKLDYFDTSIQSLSSYAPLGSYIGGDSLPVNYVAENGFLSYGYFFDEACTQKVPFSYLPTKDVTFYVGFIDPTPVLGTYYLLAEKNTDLLTLTLEAGGKATYTDGSTTMQTTYVYNGETIYFEEGRFARYFQGDIVISDTDAEDTTIFTDPYFDLNRYSFYPFLGKLENGEMHLFDGLFFTEEDPLVCKKQLPLRGNYYTNKDSVLTFYTFYGDTATSKVGSTVKTYDVTLTDTTATLVGKEETVTLTLSDLKECDAFMGSWVKSSTVNKVFTFDGAGNWTYDFTSYHREFKEDKEDKEYELVCSPNKHADGKGTYTVTDGVLRFTLDGVAYTAQFNSDGFLEITENGNTQLFYANHSYLGTWMGNGMRLDLKGLGENGLGYANYTGKDGYLNELVYEVSETDGIIALYTPLTNKNGTIYSKEHLFAYARYDLKTNLLYLVTANADSESGYATDALRLHDDYYGEWVSNFSELADVEFSFNGMGLYAYLGEKATVTLTEKGESTTVEYKLDATQTGKFSYKGNTYEISYDETAGHIVLALAGNPLLERKDELAAYDFVTMDGKKFRFDGRSTLGEGNLTVDNEKYTYAKAANGYTVFDEGTECGSMKRVENYYLLTLGAVEHKLYVSNEFMGNWAITNQYARFYIGPTDLNGVVQANYKGSDVALRYLDAATLTFDYKENKMPITYYVFIITNDKTQEKALVLSEFTNLMAGDYIICSKMDELFGTWVDADDNNLTMKFDGVTSGYTSGFAELILKLQHIEVVTEYYYMETNGRILMWSREPMAGSTVYFRLDIVTGAGVAEAAQKENAFVLRENGEIVKVLLRTEVDGLYTTKAVDEHGAKYFFDFIDGKSTLLVDGVAKYTYKITAYNTNSTVSLEVTDVATQIAYYATLDYSNAQEITFRLGDPIPAETEE